MNHIIAAGTLTEDPGTATREDGETMTGFTLAVPREDGSGLADYMVCRTESAGLAKYILDHLSAGTLVTVEGELHIEAYRDDDGHPCIYPLIAASHIRRVRTDAVEPYNANVTLPEDVPDDPHDMWEDDEAQLPF
ncbi:MAG: single-stranded DNA-binding protein [Clostridia bacterium]|nr:single-stranded DNA-binding protein [Clostridia bacterium]